MRKHLVKFKLNGSERQRTVMAENIYAAERTVREMMGVSERSKQMFVKTIKAGRTEYQVFGSVLGE